MHLTCYVHYFQYMISAREMNTTYIQSFVRMLNIVSAAPVVEISIQLRRNLWMQVSYTSKSASMYWYGCRSGAAKAVRSRVIGIGKLVLHLPLFSLKLWFPWGGGHTPSADPPL